MLKRLRSPKHKPEASPSRAAPDSEACKSTLMHLSEPWAETKSRSTVTRPMTPRMSMPVGLTGVGDPMQVKSSEILLRRAADMFRVASSQSVAAMSERMSMDGDMASDLMTATPDLTRTGRAFSLPLMESLAARGPALSFDAISVAAPGVRRFGTVVGGEFTQGVGIADGSLDHDFAHSKLHSFGYHNDSVLCVATCRLRERIKEHVSDTKAKGRRSRMTTLVFTGGQCGKIGVWDMTYLTLRTVFVAHCRTILRLFVLQRRRPLLFSTSRDASINVWDVASKQLLVRFQDFNSCVYDLTTVNSIVRRRSQESTYLFGGCQDTSIFSIKIDDFVNGSFEAKATTCASSKGGTHVCSLKQSRSADASATSSSSPSPRGKKVLSHIEVSVELEPGPGEVAAATRGIDPNTKLPTDTALLGEFIRSDPEFAKKCVVVKEMNDIYGESEAVFAQHLGCHLGFVYAIVCLNLRQVATASSDATIKIWNIGADMAPIHAQTLEGHKHSVVSLSVLGYGILVSASMDQTLKAWNVMLKRKGHTLWTMPGHREAICAMKVVCNGSVIVSGSRDGVVRFWDALTFECIHEHSLAEARTAAWKPAATGALEDEHKSAKDLMFISVAADSLALEDEMEEEEYKCDTAFVVDDFLDATSPVCAMDFAFVPPSLLVIATSSKETEIWDIAPLLKLFHIGAFHNEETVDVLKDSSMFSSSSRSTTPDTKATSTSPGRGGVVSSLPKSRPRFGESRIRSDALVPIESIGSIGSLGSIGSSIGDGTVAGKTVDEALAMCEDIDEVLAKLSLSAYSAKFAEEEIDISTLQWLSDADLRMLGLPFGPRTKIRHFLASGRVLAQQSTVGSLLLCTQMTATSSMSLLRELRTFVRFQSVSEDCTRKAECFKAARYFKDICESFGADTRFTRAHAHANPVVFARFKVGGGEELHTGGSEAPVRIVVYGHYDVVAAGDVSAWKSDPFDVVGRDGYLYGRGTTDNKGPLMAYAFALKELLEETLEEDTGAEVVVIAEGHEEFGWECGGLPECVRNNADWFSGAGLILCSNSYWIGERTPCLIYAMRGLVKMKVAVCGPKHTLHSGVHGGAFNEPAMDLMKLLSKLQSDDAKRRVLVPGFYEAVAAVTAEELQLYDEIAFSCEGYRQTVGVSKLSREGKRGVLMARGREPTLSVHSINLGTEKSSVIAKEASAVISMRTVPDQKNDELAASVKLYIEAQFDAMRSGNRVCVDTLVSGRHWASDRQSPFFQAAERALTRHWAVKPFYIRAGGTLPTCGFLTKALSAPLIQLPLGQHSDNAHLPNERICLKNLLKGKDVIKTCIQECIAVLAADN